MVSRRPRTSGSRRGPARDPQQTRTERGRWIGGIHLSGFSLMMMALIVLGVVVLAPNLKALVDQRQEIADLRQQVADQRHDVDEKKQERERWDDPTYVKTQARERFFYVSPGSISFIVIDDLDETFLDDPTAPISDRLTKTDVDWTSSMLSSILTSAFTSVDSDDPPSPASTPTPTTDDVPKKK